MAPTKSNLKRYNGGQDVFGGHGWKAFVYTGPSSYVGGAGNGDEIDGISVNNQTGLRNIDSVVAGVTVSGTFSIIAGPLSASPNGGASKWIMRWIVISTGAEVANGVDLSAEKCIVTVLGG